MALFYKYIYLYKDGEVIFYAPSRKEADEQIKETFKIDIVNFLRREPW
jgi:hypothetical protein